MTLNIIAFLILLLSIVTIIWGIAAMHMLPGRIAKGRVSTDLVNVYKALGGGWSPADTVAASAGAS